jgi:hypothetical protein
MRSKRAFGRALRRFEETYNACLEIVLSIKEGTSTSDGFNRFQPTLYAALLELSRAYHAIQTERTRLISRKRLMAPSSHARRQKELADRQQALLQAIAAGRALGDAFVWFFYRNDPELLAQHRLQQPPSPPPMGAGGEGELALVDAVRFIGDKYILFHGITSLFRLGDASLLDLQTQRIVGLGELKTQQTAKDRLALQFVASMDAQTRISSMNLASGEVVKPLGEREEGAVKPLSAKAEARLNRQLARMSSAASAAARPPAGVIELERSSMAHVDEVAEIVNAVRRGRGVSRRVSPGLLVFGMASRKRSLSSRLQHASFESPGKALPELPSEAKKLFLDGSPYNCLVMGQVFYGEEWQSFLAHGATPMLLWPTDSKALRSLATGRVAIGTIFNPAHILEAVTKQGVRVAEWRPPTTLSLSVDRDGATRRLNRVWSLLQLVYTSLYSEQYVTHILMESLTGLKGQAFPQDREVGMSFSHRVFF